MIVDLFNFMWSPHRIMTVAVSTEQFRDKEIQKLAE
jgi:hypothetical protein